MDLSSLPIMHLPALAFLGIQYLKEGITDNYTILKILLSIKELILHQRECVIVLMPMEFTVFITYVIMHKELV